MRALKGIEFLKLVTLVCVFDQAIYLTAIKIQWKDQEKFGSIVLIMGMFHILMMYMHIYSKRFSDAGIWVQSLSKWCNNYYSYYCCSNCSLRCKCDKCPTKDFMNVSSNEIVIEKTVREITAVDKASINSLLQ